MPNNVLVQWRFSCILAHWLPVAWNGSTPTHDIFFHVQIWTEKDSHTRIIKEKNKNRTLRDVKKEDKLQLHLGITLVTPTTTWFKNAKIELKVKSAKSLAATPGLFTNHSIVLEKVWQKRKKRETKILILNSDWDLLLIFPQISIKSTFLSFRVDFGRHFVSLLAKQKFVPLHSFVRKILLNDRDLHMSFMELYHGSDQISSMWNARKTSLQRRRVDTYPCVLFLSILCKYSVEQPTPLRFCKFRASSQSARSG